MITKQLQQKIVNINQLIRNKKWNVLKMKQLLHFVQLIQ